MSKEPDNRTRQKLIVNRSGDTTSPIVNIPLNAPSDVKSERVIQLLQELYLEWSEADSSAIKQLLEGKD